MPPLETAPLADALPQASGAPVRWVHRLLNGLHRLWLGPVAHEVPEVRDALLLTLREVPVLQAVELAWTVVVAVLAWHAAPNAWWPPLWLSVALVCLPVRLGLGRAGADSPGWLALRVGANVLRLLAMSVGAMRTLWLGDIGLTVLACILVVGMLALVISRWTALPRLAAALVYTAGACLVAGLWCSPLPGLRLPALMVPAGAAAYHLLTVYNHRLLAGMLRLQFENHRLSMLDPLTGLPNRRQFAEHLAQLNPVPGASRLGFALLCLDLDGFKQVNDQLGHEAGDRLLATAAQRLRQALRAQDMVCRLGGDEFVVLLPGADRPVADQVAQRLIGAVAEPFELGAEAPASVGLSLGIALCPEHGDQAEALQRQADAALYRAKRAGKGCYRWA